MSAPVSFATHEVFNQTPLLGNVDLWGGDPALVGGVKAFAAPGNADITALASFGKRWGLSEFFEFSRLANEYPPKLKTHDAKGFRADVVEFHPAYHALMRESIAAGIHCSTWSPDGKLAGAGAHVIRAARL
jgi:putative acyl-CoA dehydrogenase